MAFTKVTGTLVDIGDLDLTNVGQIQLDSIAGDADANTSITFSGSDVITIATGGAGRLTIGDGALSPVTDNQIDLGTSSLEFKDAFFDGTVTADAFSGPLTGTLQTAAQTNITSLGTLTALTGGTGDLVWDTTTLVVDSSANNVGIGTASPATPLHIKGGGDTYVTLEAGAADGNCGLLFDNSSSTQKGSFLYDTDDNILKFEVNSAERMRIDSSGRVGINRTPAISNSKLEVGGADNVPLINVEASGNTAGIGIGSSEMKFFHGTTKRLGITTAGGLNVGNTTGADGNGIQTYVADNDIAIDCEGPGRVNFSINSDETGGNRWYFRTAGSGNFGSGNGDLLVLKEDGTQIMKWDLSSMTMVGDFDDTSDVGLKENITDITDATTKIKALKPRTFDWKDKNKTQGTNGFIAQEVETVLPKLVRGDNYDPENPYHGQKAINTSGILAVAVKAIQELEARIKTLEG